MTSNNPQLVLKKIRSDIKHIQKSIGAEHKQTEHQLFLAEVFDIIEANSDLMSYDYRVPWLPGETWQKDRDAILKREVIAWATRAEEIAINSPTIQVKLNELAMKYGMKVSTVLPNYKD